MLNQDMFVLVLSVFLITTLCSRLLGAGAQCTVELYFLGPVIQAVSVTPIWQSSSSLLLEYSLII